MSQDIALQIVTIGTAGMAAQWIAWRTQVPAIVYLLLIGFIAGPFTGIIQPQVLLGDLFRPLIGLAVAIILFEGSLNLDFKEIKSSRKAIWYLIGLGVPVGWGLIAAGAHYIAGLSWPVSIVFGGMLIVTGPTVIIPMLRQARLKPRIGSVLRWEGIVNDPIGVILAVIAFEFFVHYTMGTMGAGFYGPLAAKLILVCIMGIVSGYLVGYLLDRGFMAEYLKSSFTIVYVIALYTASDMLIHESGLISVTIMGMTLANKHIQSLEEIKRFKETLSILLLSGIFILLTASLNPGEAALINIWGILFVIAVVFIIRPLTVFLSTWPSDMTFKEKLFAGLIAPRGVVCAAIAGVLGPLLVDAGFEDGAQLSPLAFLIVLVTVLLNGFTIKPLARWLGQTSGEANGVLIAGASDWSIALAQTLKDRDVPVMVADSNWHRLKKARMADIPLYYGELLSDDAEYSLELAKYSTVLAATGNEAYNALICQHFGAEIGRENAYQIASETEEGPESQQIGTTLQGRLFLDKHLTSRYMWQNHMQGWHFKVSKFRKDKNANTEHAILAGIISGSQIMFARPDIDLQPKDDDLILIYTDED